MPEPQILKPEIVIYLAQLLQVPLHGLVATAELLDQGGTVPFIARYRKEVTGNLDEVQIRGIEEKLGYFRELEDRRATVLASIESQGKLTDELRARLEATKEKAELEDLYLPYRPKRRTKATIAREKGLEPLALYLWEQQPTGVPLAEYAATFVDAEKGVASVEEALEGARHIVSERISEDADLRKALRQMMLAEGMVVSRQVTGAADEQERFKMYYDFREAVSQIPSHRMLAIRRGEGEGVLLFLIELDPARAIDYLKAQVVRQPGDWVDSLHTATEDAWQRLLSASIQTEVRLELKERSDREAIQVFRQNLQDLLLAPPAGQLGVLGIDPGIRTGCKIAVVSDTGKLLEHAVIYPLQPRNDRAGAIRVLRELVARHLPRAIAIGNGTGSREVDTLVRDFLKEEGLDSVFSVVVAETGASVYSASELARQEFPDLDLTVRGAVSIARRLQDPLAELVKIDPKSIGVGQYQHDVDQRQLQASLEAVVESCVNRVGVDLNTASWALLRYVAGVTERTAQRIVEYRDQHGAFRTRGQLIEVPGVGPKTFEQAAGFLRIRGGDQPLDMTAVHPESYPVVERLAASAGVSVTELVRDPKLLDSVKPEGLEVGRYTLDDILQELRRPGRDPRQQFVAPSFAEGVHELTDLQPGMSLEGVVTNVTRFGAFIDVGVHQDGLVHVSELSNRYVADPSTVVKVGQIVKVQVLSADPKARRIALSMKALASPPPARPGRTDRGRKPAPVAPPPEPSMEEKLAALTAKWQGR